MKKTLQQIGVECRTDKATYHLYCPFYQSVFEYRKFDPKIVIELGVKDGASIRMWKEYFDKAMVVGVDVDINCAKNIPHVEVYNFDATDESMFRRYLGGVKADLIIDDASHFTSHQQIAFKFLFRDFLNVGGIYIIEDIHTSFYPSFVDSEFTTIDLLKQSDLDYMIFENWKGERKDSMTAMIFKTLN